MLHFNDFIISTDAFRAKGSPLLAAMKPSVPQFPLFDSDGTPAIVIPVANFCQGLQCACSRLHCLQLWHHLALGVNFPLLRGGRLANAYNLVSQGTDFLRSGNRVVLSCKDKKEIDVVYFANIRAVLTQSFYDPCILLFGN